MFSSYTEVLSAGNQLQSNNPPYNKIELTQDTETYWSSQSLSSTNVIAAFTDVVQHSPEGTYKLFLPDATLVAPGISFIIVNSSQYPIPINGFLAKPIESLSGYKEYYFCLTSNVNEDGSPNKDGEWGISNFGSGAVGIQSITAVAPAKGISIAGSPIEEGAGTLTFGLTNTLDSLETVGTGGGTGLVYKSGENTVMLKSIAASDANVVVAGGADASANITVGLNPEVTLTSLNCGNVSISGNQIATPQGVDGVIDTPGSYSSIATILKNGSGQTVTIAPDPGNISIPHIVLPGIFPDFIPQDTGAVLYISRDGVISLSRKYEAATPEQVQSSSNNATFITPLNSKYINGLASSTVVFNGTTVEQSQTVLYGQNIQSVHRVELGKYVITFSTVLESEYYECSCSCGTIGEPPLISDYAQSIPRDGTSAFISTFRNNEPYEFSYVSGVFFGTIALPV